MMHDWLHAHGFEGDCDEFLFGTQGIISKFQPLNQMTANEQYALMLFDDWRRDDFLVWADRGLEQSEELRRVDNIAEFYYETVAATTLTPGKQGDKNEISLASIPLPQVPWE